MSLKEAQEETSSPQGDPNEPSKFQELMKCAVAVKSCQIASKRRRFDLLPQFEQASLYFQRKHKNLRKQNTRIKLLAFDNLFRSARQLLAQNDLDRSAHRLEEALAIFRSVVSKAEDQTTQNAEILFDSQMVINQSVGKDEAQNHEIKRRMLMAYVNLAGIYFKSESFKNAKRACDFALDIDCSSIFALQIRAISRIQGANYDLEDMKESLEDLRLALEIDPFNPFSHQKYEQLTKEYKITEFKERVAYGKMFNDEVPYTPEKQVKSVQLEGSGNVNGGTGGTGVEGPVIVEEIVEEKKFTKVPAIDEKLPEIKESVEPIQKLKKKSFKEDFEEVMKEKKTKKKVTEVQSEMGEITEKKKKKENYFQKGPSGKYLEMEEFDQLISNANEITEMFEKAGRKEEADEMRDKVREMTEVKESFEKMFNMDLSLPQNQLLFFAKRRGMDLNKPQIKKEIYHFRVEQLKKLRSFLKKSGPVIRDLKKDSKLAIESIERSKLKRLEFLRNNQASNSEISKELMLAAFVIIFVLVGWTLLNMFLF